MNTRRTRKSIAAATVLAVLAPLTVLLLVGCSKQEEAAKPAGGGTYYTGPLAKKGGDPNQKGTAPGPAVTGP